MYPVDWSSLIAASLAGSAAILVCMYLLLPALGLPRLDYAGVISGWVKATGRYARAVGVIVFLAGGIAWGAFYAAIWPTRGPLAGVAFALVPFVVSYAMVLPQLSRFRAMVVPMPGFVDVRAEGRRAMIAMLAEHLVYGLVLGLMY